MLVPEEELLRPDPNHMTPTARALFEALFPSQPASTLQAATETRI